MSFLRPSHIRSISMGVGTFSLSLVLIIPVVLGATLIFTERVLQANYRANTVAIIDLDDDGDSDIVAANNAYDEVFWYKNNGSETFTKTAIDGSFTDPRVVFPVDLDEDGDIDVVVAAPDDGDRIVWYDNNGSETFTERTIESSANGPISLDVRDIDDDNDLDIVSYIFTDNDLFWYKNNGSESFARQTVDTGLQYGNNVHIVDLDGDGDMDFVSAGLYAYWYESTGSGTTFTKRTASNVNDYVSFVQGIDLDEDGDIDIVAKRSNKLFWLRNNGSESFAEVVISTEYSDFGDFQAVDIDADGDIDIAIAAADSNGSILLYLNDGNESFTKQVVNNAFYKAKFIDVGDVDGDGDLDIAAAPANMWTGDISWFETAPDTTPPTVSTLSPADNATSVSLSANLVITFNEAARAGTGTLTIKKTSDNSIVETITVSGALLSGNGTTQLTLNPATTLADSTEYYVLWNANALKDTDGNHVAAQASTTYWTFTTVDVTGPSLSAFSPAHAATDVSTGSSITWNTNELASSQVQYGFTSAFGNLTARTDTSPRVITGHTVSLGALEECTTYYYRAISADAAWNTTTGSTLSFTTAGCVNNAGVDTATGSSLPAGGTGSLNTNPGGAGTNVRVPASELPTPLVLQIKKLTDETVIALTLTPAGKALTGDHTYSIRAFRGATPVTTFTDPVTVTMIYTDAQVSGLQESTLKIYRWSGSVWQELNGCSVDSAANTVTCTTTNFSTFGLFGTAVTTDDSTAAESSPQQGGGRRPETLAQLISAARSTIADRFASSMRTSVADEGTPAVHAAATVPDAFSTDEERRLYRATQKTIAAGEAATLHQLRLSRIAEKQKKLLALVDDVQVLYRDVGTDTWFAPYVAELVTRKIATGYADAAGKPTGEFGVSNPVTYAEVLKMALKASGSEMEALPPPRNASARGTWAESFVAQAEVKGISVFVPSLNVHAPASRGEVIRIVLETLEFPTSIKISPSFADVPSSHPHAQAIAAAAAYGFIAGDSDASGKPLNVFRPDAPINRAEVAKIIALVHEAMQR